MVQFLKEDEFRDWVQKELELRLAVTHYVVLKSKNVNDIVVCIQREDESIALFVEVKYFTASKGRLGLGDGDGKGFQPEILTRRPTYFEKHVRWLIGSEQGRAVLVSSDQLRRHAVGGVFKEGKQNNIQPSVLGPENQPFPMEESPAEVAKWVESICAVPPNKTLVRQAKLGASCRVRVPAEQGLTIRSYRVLQLRLRR